MLSVGDAAFQAKCLRRIEALREGGKTIVFISHDLRAVERLCDRVLLLQRGEVAASGRPQEVIAAYERTARDFKPAPHAGASPEVIVKAAEVTSVTFRKPREADADPTRTGSPLVVRLDYRARENINDACFEVHFFSRDDDVHCHLTTALGGERIDVEAGAGAVEFFCPELGLQPGHYFIDATIKYRGTPPGDDLDWRYHCALLRVDSGRPVRGTFYMPYQWSVSQNGIGGFAAAGPP